jgi:hypothetical protein
VKCRAASHPLFSDLPSDAARFPTAVYRIIPTNTPSRLIYHAAVTNPAPSSAGRPGGSDFGNRNAYGSPGRSNGDRRSSWTS